MQVGIFRTAAVCAVLWIAGCASSPAVVVAGEPTPAAAPAAFGPKKTVAVSRFDATGAFVASYGGYDVVGGGLAAMLVTSLERTGRFIVVDRSDLSDVLREQEMGLRGLTTANTSPQAGSMLGAQAIIRGSITEFDSRTRGGGFSLGGVAQSVPLGGAISPRGQKGIITADFKVVDTTTSRVIEAFAVEKAVSAKSLGLSVATDDVSIGADGFEKTPLGQASRSMIDEAVRVIVAALEPIAWQAMVAKVSGDTVYVNAGANANLRIGDHLELYRVTDKVVDPVTQEVLGVEEARIGVVRIANVNPRYSTASYTGSYPAEVGDILRYARARPMGSGY
jgi:curli biogenesis system outer membrane secretion channel CsgG